MRRIFTLYFKALRSDYLLIHFSAVQLVIFAVLLALTPFHRCRIATLDFFVSTRRRSWEPLLRWSLRRVDLFIVYFRDATRVAREFGLAPGKFQFIPYKVNAYDLIRDTPVSDGGYIFVGGRSRRDFTALFGAVEDLGYPVKVVTSWEPELGVHGSRLDGLEVPLNVEVLRKDARPEFFVRCLAGARIVVIPLVKGSLTQSGIAVYMQAMAARKCTIVSSGLGVDDVLKDGQAIVVPAGDSHALRDAIEHAWNDAAYRECYAAKGYDYAVRCGDGRELRKSILQVLARSLKPGETSPALARGAWAKSLWERVHH